MAVDTSALMAIVLHEAEAEACKAALEEEPEPLICRHRCRSLDRRRPA